MSFDYPVALHMPTVQRTSLASRIGRFIHGGGGVHRPVGSLAQSFAELLFDPNTLEWLETKQLVRDTTDPVALLSRGHWVKMDLQVRMGRGTYFCDLISFPVTEGPEFGGLQISFDGKAFASVFEFEPRAMGGYDPDAKQALLSFCLTAADLLGSEGFILLPNDGSHFAAPLDDLKAAIVRANVNVPAIQARLITGVRASMVDSDLVRSSWALDRGDKRLVVSTQGYCVVDLVHQQTQ